MLGAKLKVKPAKRRGHKLLLRIHRRPEWDPSGTRVGSTDGPSATAPRHCQDVPWMLLSAVRPHPASPFVGSSDSPPCPPLSAAPGGTPAPERGAHTHHTAVIHRSRPQRRPRGRGKGHTHGKHARKPPPGDGGSGTAGINDPLGSLMKAKGKSSGSGGWSRVRAGGSSPALQRGHGNGPFPPLAATPCHPHLPSPAAPLKLPRPFL